MICNRQIFKKKKKAINFIQSGKIVVQNQKKYFEGNEVINVLSGKIIER